MSVERACVKCGEAKANTVEIFRDDTLCASGSLCEWCLAAACAEADILREQFMVLVEAGVPRQLANQMMIARMQGRMPLA